MCEEKKVIYGQFFTTEQTWLKKHIVEFIYSSKAETAYDPFAGAGDLLRVAEEIGIKKTVGLDIDKSLNWKVNDSLKNIPHINNSIIITNPPYLSNYSASRKNIRENLDKYFSSSCYDDLYLIALERMLQAQDYVVAIIPETFINSNFKFKSRLHSITIVEEKIFSDTETPVVVACFDGVEKSLYEVAVYKNDNYVNTLGDIEQKRLFPLRKLKIAFNDKNGWLGVRCVDSTNPNEKLRFDYKERIQYDWNKGIKDSSRLLTLVQVDIPLDKRLDFIKECNKILNQTRIETQDIIFSPFKGNMSNGVRRRRLDYFTCRAIIEKAYNNVVVNA